MGVPEMLWLRAGGDRVGGFVVQVMSDQDYEDLIAEVLYEGQLCFVLTQEGERGLEIQLHPRDDGSPWNFALADYQAAIDDAKTKLWRLRRTEDGPEPAV